MYGTAHWRIPYDDKQRGILSPEELRDALLNLMRWRLQNVLGYRVTHSFGMKNTHGQDLYNMIFATGHPAGETIMTHVYRKAAEAQPKMRAEALAKLQAEKEEEAGILSLLPPLPKLLKGAPLYTHEPPQRPYGLTVDG